MCGISKGSLYQYFKSKEELEMSIFLYCAEMIQDAIIQAEQDFSLEPKELMHKQVEIMLAHVLELKEFVYAQFSEQSLSPKNPELQKCIEEKRTKTFRWFREKLIAVYGERIDQYTVDLTLYVGGTLSGYVHLLFIPGLQPNIHQMSRHFMLMLDGAVHTLLTQKPEPLVPMEIWTMYLESRPSSSEALRHPLVIMKQMKDEIKNADLLPIMKEDALQSILILEKELLELTPRRAILSGMLANLSQLPELGPLNDELKHVLQSYSLSKEHFSMT